jgi:hypothetical protein
VFLLDGYWATHSVNNSGTLQAQAGNKLRLAFASSLILHGSSRFPLAAVSFI